MRRTVRIFFSCMFPVLCYFGVMALLSVAELSTVFAAVIADSLLAGVCFFLYCNHHREADNLFCSFRSGDLAKFFLLCFAVWFVSQASSQFVLQFVNDTAFVANQSAASSDKGLYFILTLVIAPVSEELLFRGVWFRELSLKSVSLAYIVSTCFFAVSHGTLVHLPLAFLCGLLFCVVYDYSNHICYSILLHSLFNLLTLVSQMVYPTNIVFFVTIVLSYLALCFVLIGFAARRIDLR